MAHRLISPSSEWRNISPLSLSLSLPRSLSLPVSRRRWATYHGGSSTAVPWHTDTTPDT
jgi:hypothetical protein